VWLLTGGGAIFAAFPHVYATVFSGFYLALMLVLYALIFRAVSFEFHARVETESARKAWSLAFGLGSALPGLLFGVALGSIIRGLPVDAEMNFTGNFFTLLNPYALLVGVLGLSMLATHGAIWLLIKAEGELREKATSWAKSAWTAFFVLFMVASIVTILWLPERLANFKSAPMLWIIPIATIVFLILLRSAIAGARYGSAFFFSALSIVSMWALTGASIFPALVPARGNPELSLTIMNASSSQLTLQVMLILAIIGMPFVIGYTIWIYSKFRGPISSYGEGAY